jgi:chromosome segregation ATPase
MRLDLQPCDLGKAPRGGAYGSRRSSADPGEAEPTEVPLGKCAVRHESRAAPARLRTNHCQKRGFTMTDDRIVQRLEEQLRDAHAPNADLRERLGDIKKREEAANVIRVEGRDALAQLEKAHAKQKQAEAVATTATRKREDAEREALRARGKLEELQERFDRAQAEADVLNDLNDRIESAKHAGDLFRT